MESDAMTRSKKNLILLSLCGVTAATLVYLVTVATRRPIQKGETAAIETVATPREWTTAGHQWRLRVKQYARTWLLSSAFAAREEPKGPRVQSEIEVVAETLEPRVEGNRRLGRIQFKGSWDTPKVI